MMLGSGMSRCCFVGRRGDAMSETMHTPGPWLFFRRVGRLMPFHVTADGRETIVTIRRDAPNAEANARLIAAAPELYEALQALVTMQLSRDLCPFGKSYAQECECNYHGGAKQARAALAKANGASA